jgi:hypothetical protein
VGLIPLRPNDAPSSRDYIVHFTLCIVHYIVSLSSAVARLPNNQAIAMLTKYSSAIGAAISV